MNLEKHIPFFFLIPSLVIIFSLFIYPTLYSLYLCFFDIKAYSFGGFVGLRNFQNLIFSFSFLNSLYVTFNFVFLSLVIEFFLGLGLAILLNRVHKGANLLRAIFTLPFMVTPVIVGLIFRLIYSPEYGILNELFAFLGLEGQLWLINPKTAILALVAVDVWEWTPFVTLILLAGIKSIPPTYYEVASIYGASRIKQFTHVTLPLLKPHMLIAIIFNLMRAFKTFDIVVMLTKGGPGESTNLISYYIQQVAISYMKLSQGAAATQILLLIILIIANLYIAYLKKWIKIT